MAKLTVVAVRQGFLKSEAKLIRVGTVFTVDDEKVVKENGRPKLNPDGTLLKQKWLRPVANEHEGKRVAAEVQKAAENKNAAAAQAASGGKVAKQKTDDAASLAG